MGISELYPPSLLNVAEVNRQDLWEKPLQVTGWELREFQQDRETTRKLVLFFAGLDVGLGLNVTNARALRGAWGDDYTTWKGKVLKLVRVRVLYKGQQVDSVGVATV